LVFALLKAVIEKIILNIEQALPAGRQGINNPEHEKI
jgi:hypothetical protein